MPDQGERHQVEREERHDELEDAIRGGAADQLAIDWQDQDQQQRLDADGVAAKFGGAFRQDERFAHRPDQVVGHHEREGLQRQDPDAATLARLHAREERQESLDGGQALRVMHGVSPGLRLKKSARPT